MLKVMQQRLKPIHKFYSSVETTIIVINHIFMTNFSNHMLFRLILLFHLIFLVAHVYRLNSSPFLHSPFEVLSIPLCVSPTNLLPRHYVSLNNYVTVSPWSSTILIQFPIPTQTKGVVA